MSESVEMYLVMTALLRREPALPVPITALAGRLGVSQVSANEMCHRLSERGLLDYQPYKGVTLTAAGEEHAQQILARRRLWATFLVELLGIEPQEADELACQLEHIRSEQLVAALVAFLERTTTSQPQGGSIAQPLSSCPSGTHGRIAAVEADPIAVAFLRSQGIVSGAEAEVLAVGADGAMLLEVTGRTVALGSRVVAKLSLIL